MCTNPSRRWDRWSFVLNLSRGDASWRKKLLDESKWSGVSEELLGFGMFAFFVDSVQEFFLPSSCAFSPTFRQADTDAEHPSTLVEEQESVSLIMLHPPSPAKFILKGDLTNQQRVSTSSGSLLVSANSVVSIWILHVFLYPEVTVLIFC